MHHVKQPIRRGGNKPCAVNQNKHGRRAFCKAMLANSLYLMFLLMCWKALLGCLSEVGDDSSNTPALPPLFTYHHILPWNVDLLRDLKKVSCCPRDLWQICTLTFPPAPTDKFLRATLLAAFSARLTLTVIQSQYTATTSPSRAGTF